MPIALIVDDDMDHVLALAESFRERGYSTATAGDLATAREALLKTMPEVAVFAERVEGRESLELLEQLDIASVMHVVLMSDKRSVSAAARAMRLGISDYLETPVDIDSLARGLDALEASAADPDDDKVEKTGRGLLVGESPPMQRLYRLIRKCAPSDAAILITGESGVGKELVARTLHELSARSSQEMICVNCSAIPKDLMESELFGHVKGSFTGATNDHRGLFERATGGTLFFDEITEMDPALQSRLLRVLEVQRVRPVGSESDIAVDARIIAATNKDPDEAVADGKLREDLYYRLAQFPLYVPPLRERDNDVLELADVFLQQQNAAAGIERRFDEDVREIFKLHDWPGNVRELKNAVMHGHLLAGDSISVDDLPDGIPATLPLSGQYVRTSVGTPLKEVERRHILSTLAHFQGDKKKTAETLGISLKTLYNRLKAYGK